MDWVTAVPTQHEAEIGHGTDVAEAGRKIKNGVFTAEGTAPDDMLADTLATVRNVPEITVA